MGLDQIQVELQEWMGNDRSIANSAWTSSYDRVKAVKKSDKEVEKIVKHLAEYKHGTPFESVIMRFWIRMPIYTDRQHMTYRMASHSGLSGRYRTLPEDYYLMPKDVKAIISKIEKVNPPLSDGLSSNYDFMIEASIAAYRDILYFAKKAQDQKTITNSEYKRVREVSRGLIPTANMIERTTILNFRSFANYMKQRLDKHAQPEIRRVAELMLETVKKADICPIAIAALEKEGWQI